MPGNDVVVFGDSVTWGQGHQDANKFANKVGAALGLPVQMIAHSGATIGYGDTQTGACGPEAPVHYPTIFQQVARATDDPASAAVVIITGGINDISVQTILAPVTPKRFLTFLTRRYCHHDMVALLTAVLSRYHVTTTKIVVTSYFPIFSTQSDVWKVLPCLHALGIAPPPHLTADADRQRFAFASVELALLFWQESRAQLQRAVTEMSSSRVVFADVPFQEANAMFAPDAWLFNVHLDPKTGRVVPEDDVIAARHAQCVSCHPGDPNGVSVCDIASAGHPNRAGADQFAHAILAALGR